MKLILTSIYMLIILGATAQVNYYTAGLGGHRQLKLMDHFGAIYSNGYKWTGKISIKEKDYVELINNDELLPFHEKKIDSIVFPGIDSIEKTSAANTTFVKIDGRLMRKIAFQNFTLYAYTPIVNEALLPLYGELWMEYKGLLYKMSHDNKFSIFRFSKQFESITGYALQLKKLSSDERWNYLKTIDQSLNSCQQQQLVYLTNTEDRAE